MKINLSKKDLGNLIVFLNRVQLQGSEAIALVKILQVIETQMIEGDNFEDKPENKNEKKHSTNF